MFNVRLLSTAMCAFLACGTAMAQDEMTQPEAPAFEAVREELVASLRERTLSERVSELMVAGTVDQSVSVGIDPALINDYTIVGD